MADKFTWYELMTTEPKAATAFYGKVFGWTAAPPAPGMEDYIVLSTNDVGVAGISQLQPGMPPPVWAGYINVPDVDARTKRVSDTGGVVHQPPTDVPGMLRFSMVADPQGAVFFLFTEDAAMQGQDAPPPPPMRGAAGYANWRELQTDGADAAFDWYAALFGWERSEAMDMGPMGKYQMFTAGGDEMIGAMMNRQPDIPAPYWQYYFGVEGGAAAAVERIKAAGGTILNEPMQVPGGEWVADALDPQGARFGLVAQIP